MVDAKVRIRVRVRVRVKLRTLDVALLRENLTLKR